MITILFAIALAVRAEDLDVNSLQYKKLTRRIPPREVCEMFTPLEHKYTGGKYSDKTFYYRLFEPVQDQPNKKYPLIVWMHGYGIVEVRGLKNIGQLKWLSLIFETANREDYPFYLLAMQCVREPRRWFAEDGVIGEDDMLTVYKEILDKTIRQYPIDPDRITLSGVSTGGAACWEMAMRYPEEFAAIAPLGSYGGDTTRASLLTGVPIWSFHSCDDRPERARQLVAAVTERGGTAMLTEIDTDFHNCWTDAFVNYPLLDWLLIQKRGESSPRPGSLPISVHVAQIIDSGDWVKFASVLGVLALVLVVWQKESRRRQATVHQQVED